MISCKYRNLALSLIFLNGLQDYLVNYTLIAKKLSAVHNGVFDVIPIFKNTNSSYAQSQITIDIVTVNLL